MPTSSSNSQSSTSNSPNQGGNKNTIYIALAAVAVVVIIVLLYAFSGLGSAGVQPGTVGTVNGTPVYMSLSAMEGVMGTSANYTTIDLFNMSSPANISIIESITPLATYNVTEGWVTFANSQNATENASIQYYVMSGHNQSKVADSIASSAASEFPTPPQTAYGTYNGLSYTYQIYRNSSVNTQILTGYRGNYSVLTLLISNSTFEANQTTFIAASADSLP